MIQDHMLRKVKHATKNNFKVNLITDDHNNARDNSTISIIYNKKYKDFVRNNSTKKQDK